MAQRMERVTEVIDGDSFKTSVRKRSVRLSGARAPSARTSGGKQATQELKRLIEGQRVSVRLLGRDIHGRGIGWVKTEDGRSVNAIMSHKLLELK